ncbi:hypothetical protein BDV25DRAFT_161650 [Aspergillus avenaceus]|uniref:EH domain-containing protein n=1 Tax=Aspergillus avenaceus TaxID=36643 RepID=A0A5N6TKF3_ASPAV|nr:hypothetical protein BDV25DRAFT_161650 [Aspergillus avenaceus]
MASSTPVLDQRVPPHFSSYQTNAAGTALQAATAAFRAGPSRSSSPAPTSRSGVAKNVNHGVLDTGIHPDDGSEAPPEVGSVKDKIGRYTARSQQAGAQEALGDVRRNTAPFRSQSPQQIAARFAAEHSSVQRRSSTATGRTMHETHHIGSDDTLDLKALAAELIKNSEAQDKLVQKPSPDSSALPSRDLSIRRKPVMHSSNISAEPSQVTTRSRPTPPAPRKTGSVMSRPRSVESTSIGARSNEVKAVLEPLSSQSSIRSVDLSSLSEGPPPMLPPRPGESAALKNGRSHRTLLKDKEIPRRPLSPSTSSIYSRSHNNSRSSLSGMTEDAISDAIVASSLASSRAPPTRKLPPPPPPQRRTSTHSLLHRHASRREASQSPSPASALRRTLRDPVKSDDEDDDHHRHRKHILRKHPHKHHEGDRKRWRSEITEKERKRYEGVWAANKGLVVPTQQEVDKQCSPKDPLRHRWPSNASEMVANVVVRDIWSRSRLQFFVLEQIWDLVDSQKIGLLTREEFVVGMWLIDQQLKGHKLPARVPDSVWGSVRRVPGIILRDIEFHS